MVFARKFVVQLCRKIARAVNSAPDASTEADRAEASAAGQDLLQALSQAIGRLGQIEVNDENSLQRVFRDINETACALVGLERCVIWCVDGGDVMRCADRYDALTQTHSGGEHADFAEIGEPEAFVDSQFAVFDDLHTVSSDGKPIAELLISFGVRACIVARIWVDGAIAGYLTLCRTSGPHAWQAGEAAVAEVLATLAGKSLEAAARHDAMRSLRVERARVQSFAELASDCFWETDAEGRFSMLSPGAEAVFCQETASLLARTPWEALRGERVDLQALQMALQARRPLKNAQLTLAGTFIQTHGQVDNLAATTAHHLTHHIIGGTDVIVAHCLLQRRAVGIHNLHNGNASGF